MLDKELCKMFGVGEFEQWIIAELDSAEDTLFSDEKMPIEDFIRLSSRYDTLKEVRDVYAKLKPTNHR